MAHIRRGETRITHFRLSPRPMGRSCPIARCAGGYFRLNVFDINGLVSKPMFDSRTTIRFPAAQFRFSAPAASIQGPEIACGNRTRPLIVSR